AARALPALAARGWFADEAIVVIEHAVGNAPDAPAGFTLVDEREYGETALTILRYDGTDEG
ncbi:MAG: 16S rRNA (guanine(966)-N(2))-methyltransferase RsmD, partial [Alphaproteobacteria bacterium]